ncbi:MAG: 1,4-alpha-glucan branching enzyme [Alphaproteobacteria bacterium]|nr:1,4-alpha-glucan branching enzyme [Alphaproteobacteria bacterium]
MTMLSPLAWAVIEGRAGDPFAYLGLHREDGRNVVRAFLPEARKVSVLQDDRATELPRIHDAGLFAGPVPSSNADYRLRAEYDGGIAEFHDAYRFPPLLGDMDLYLLGEGRHLELYEKLGAHPRRIDGVDGVAFAVYAPNAQRVSVVGDFNFWDGRRHQMRVRGQGYWEIFVPGAKAGDHYKYEIRGHDGQMQPLKSDPVGFAARLRPDTSSVVFDISKLPQIAPAPKGINDRDQPISIYEVHLGSWRKRDGHHWLNYRELAEQLPSYAKDMGFTHIEMLPVSEHPFDGSWGYQPTGLFAPTSRFGSPGDFAHLVDACHRAGLGVILDWVPGHFPDDAHGLANFTGHPVYEHADPRQGRHLDWGTLIYNYGRVEVTNFLLANALFWLDLYGVDGLRVDAVASMLYLDYSRPQDGWVPNRHGGRENLDAIDLLQRTNREVFGKFPAATTIAEESTAWPGVSRPVDYGGLGFGYKWNMGWMHDTLQYMKRDPIHRRHHHGEIGFGLHYAFSENFVLPLSHDEVVHGKGSILGKMPGDEWQRFANLRVYYAMMFGHPGKKLLFMGDEIAQQREWNHDDVVDWMGLADPKKRGVQNLVRDLNRLYRDLPALHRKDCEADGFAWLVGDDAQNSVFVWLRKGGENELCVLALNMTPQVLRGYRFAVPKGGKWRESLNTDSHVYGGSNVGNSGGVVAQEEDGRFMLTLDLPPLSGLFLVPGE